MRNGNARMLRPAVLLLALALCGCVQPPERPADEGERFTFRSASTPYTAAICIGRNVKGRAGAAGEERTFGDSGMEVIVRSRAGAGGTLAVAQIVRDGIFANVTVLVTKLIGADRGGFARALMAGC